MLTRLFLLTCALSAGQASDWQLAAPPCSGQELVYSGFFSEEALNAGVQFQHTFKVDTTVLVLEAAPKKLRWPCSLPSPPSSPKRPKCLESR